jgi:TnpA family transposase
LERTVRTAFLLQYLADAELREQITASTSKVEVRQRIRKWLFFGGDWVDPETDPEEQRSESST